MYRRHLLSAAALGGLVALAFGSAGGTSGGQAGDDAVRELKPKICKGSDPFMLPIDDDKAIAAAFQSHTNPLGIYAATDYEVIKGQVDKSAGWATGSGLEKAEVDAAGAICDSTLDCDGYTCVAKESILSTQWQLAFRDGASGWQLVGFFMGSLTDDPARTAAVDKSIADWKAELDAKLPLAGTPGTPAPAAPTPATPAPVAADPDPGSAPAEPAPGREGGGNRGGGGGGGGGGRGGKARPH